MAGSLGVCDSESCWFMEEIGTYMRCWESPGDLPLAKRHKISITRGRSPGHLVHLNQFPLDLVIVCIKLK